MWCAQKELKQTRTLRKLIFRYHLTLISLLLLSLYKQAIGYPSEPSEYSFKDNNACFALAISPSCQEVFPESNSVLYPALQHQSDAIWMSLSFNSLFRIEACNERKQARTHYKTIRWIRARAGEELNRHSSNSIRRAFWNRQGPALAPYPGVCGTPPLPLPPMARVALS